MDSLHLFTIPGWLPNNIPTRTMGDYILLEMAFRNERYPYTVDRLYQFL